MHKKCKVHTQHTSQTELTSVKMHTCTNGIHSDPLRQTHTGRMRNGSSHGLLGHYGIFALQGEKLKSKQYRVRGELKKLCTRWASVIWVYAFLMMINSSSVMATNGALDSQFKARKNNIFCKQEKLKLLCIIRKGLPGWQKNACPSEHMQIRLHTKNMAYSCLA